MVFAAIESTPDDTNSIPGNNSKQFHKWFQKNKSNKEILPVVMEFNMKNKYATKESNLLETIFVKDN